RVHGTEWAGNGATQRAGRGEGAACPGKGATFTGKDITSGRRSNAVHPRRASHSDDSHSPPHCRTSRRSAKNCGVADDLQSGRHVVHHGPAKAVPGGIPGEVSNQARLHVVLREG